MAHSCAPTIALHVSLAVCLAAPIAAQEEAPLYDLQSTTVTFTDHGKARVEERRTFTAPKAARYRVTAGLAARNELLSVLAVAAGRHVPVDVARPGQETRIVTLKQPIAAGANCEVELTYRVLDPVWHRTDDSGWCQVEWTVAGVPRQVREQEVILRFPVEIMTAGALTTIRNLGFWRKLARESHSSRVAGFRLRYATIRWDAETGNEWVELCLRRDWIAPLQRSTLALRVPEEWLAGDGAKAEPWWPPWATVVLLVLGGTILLWWLQNLPPPEEDEWWNPLLWYSQARKWLTGEDIIDDWGEDDVYEADDVYLDEEESALVFVNRDDVEPAARDRARRMRPLWFDRPYVGADDEEEAHDEP